MRLRDDFTAFIARFRRGGGRQNPSAELDFGTKRRQKEVTSWRATLFPLSEAHRGGVGPAMHAVSQRLEVGRREIVRLYWHSSFALRRTSWRASASSQWRLYNEGRRGWGVRLPPYTRC
mmetsp:Transcript_115662/g.327026  ORF Transcript_115662/g.327026 Transcript_115662/m.327026 type:complete len:119 (-) Transcript_115662:9-365(-)